MSRKRENPGLQQAVEFWHRLPAVLALENLHRRLRHRREEAAVAAEVAALVVDVQRGERLEAEQPVTDLRRVRRQCEVHALALADLLLERLPLHRRLRGDRVAEVTHHLLLAEVRPLGAEVEDDPREDRVQRRVPEAPPTEHVHAHQVFEVRQLPVEPHLRAVRLPEEAEERRRRLRERVRGELRQLLDRAERLLRREVDEQRLPRLEDDLDGGRLVQRAAQEDVRD